MFNDPPRRMSVIVVRETPNIWARVFQVEGASSDHQHMGFRAEPGGHCAFTPCVHPRQIVPRAAISVPVGLPGLFTQVWGLLLVSSYPGREGETQIMD